MSFEIRRALEIIENGELIEEHWHDDGDPETGPLSGATLVYHYESDELRSTPNGSVILSANDGVHISNVYLSSTVEYTGISALIGDHFRALKTNAQRNGLEFVLSGRRPSTGYYALDEILKREERARAVRLS